MPGKRAIHGAFSVLQLKIAWSDGTSHLVYEPLDFLSRLAALTPRPRTNLVFYHRLLAPNARWRDAAARVVRLTMSELQLFLEGSALVGRVALSPAPFVVGAREKSCRPGAAPL